MKIGERRGEFQIDRDAVFGLDLRHGGRIRSRFLQPYDGRVLHGGAGDRYLP
ncbi:hypothetical protein D3C71_2102060 [compost metagenome]